MNGSRGSERNREQVVRRGRFGGRQLAVLGVIEGARQSKVFRLMGVGATGLQACWCGGLSRSEGPIFGGHLLRPSITSCDHQS